MAIVSLREILQDARSGRYAVPLFDAQSMGMIRAAVEFAAAPNDAIHNLAVCHPAETVGREVICTKIRLFGCGGRRGLA